MGPSGVASSSLPASRPASRLGTATSRPGTGSRPGTSSGDKVCSYECFRKVHLQHALQVAADPAEEAPQETAPATRHFCGDECVERYRRALDDRGERAKQLVQLRIAVL